MRRVAVSALVAASLLGVALLLTACGSGTRHGYSVAAVSHGYSVAAVKAAFSAEGVRLHPFRPSDGKPAGETSVYLLGKQHHPIFVKVGLGPYRGPYKHLTYQPSAPGSERAQYRNVLLAWVPDDQAVVVGALRRLK